MKRLALVLLFLLTNFEPTCAANAKRQEREKIESANDS